MWLSKVIREFGESRRSGRQGRVGGKVRPRSRRPLRLESLEERQLLSIDLVSTVDPSLYAATGSSYSESASISDNGRYAAFTSDAANLVANDTNWTTDVFVKDLQTGTVTRVSTDSSGNEGNNASSSPSISSDGDYVAFVSLADNLVPGDTNENYDVFVKNLQTGAITRASTDEAGNEFFWGSGSPSISGDGRYVAFEASGYPQHIVVKDLQEGTVTTASLNASGNASDQHCYSPSISSDGCYVAFYSSATNLVADDANGTPDVFVTNLQTGEITRVSTDGAGTEGNSASQDPSISEDGHFVAFLSSADNLVDDDTNGQLDVFVKDVWTGDVTRASTDDAGDQFSYWSGLSPSISSDGGYVAFSGFLSESCVWDQVFLKNLETNSLTAISTYASGEYIEYGAAHPSVSRNGGYVAFESVVDDLVTIDSNDRTDIFVKDVQAGSVVLASSRNADLPQEGVSGDATSGDPSVSADARYVAFASDADDLVPGDTNGESDVFVKDLVDGTVTRVSTDASGNEAARGGEIYYYEFGSPSISGDGKYVAFQGSIDDLVPDDTNDACDIFVKEIATGEVIRASTSETGAEADGPSTEASLSISDVGSYVAFTSSATNLVASDTNGYGDIFVKNLTTDAVTRVSTSSSGAEADGYSRSPSISADGRYVAFVSDATNLVAGDTNGTWDVFVKDLQENTVTRVSTDVSGTQVYGQSDAPSISVHDGRVYVAFKSYATNLVADDTDIYCDIFVKELGTDDIVRASTNASGTPAYGNSDSPSISADGRYVGFSSYSSSLVAGDTNRTVDVFVKDLHTGAVTRLSVGASGNNVNSSGYSPSISGDGSCVAFASYAPGLVPLDFTTTPDVFLATLPSDLTPPNATLNAADVSDDGGTAYTFTVTYSDDKAVDVSTLDDGDVLVTGPNGFSQEATLVSVDKDSDGTPRTATYQITPPGGAWNAADNGTYTVSVQADEVADTSGKSVAAGSLGTFAVAIDGAAPTASLDAATVNEAGEESYTFTVTYTDDTAIDVGTLDDSDVLVTGPNGFSQEATLVQVDKDWNGTPRTATYEITPPGGAWDLADNGTYTVSVRADEVADASGKSVAAGSLGTFAVAIDGTPPTASLDAANVSEAGEESYTFTVTYTDDMEIDVGTLDDSDVLVTGPNGFTQEATLVDVEASSDYTLRTATYRITPPGGAWDSADNGTYTVSVHADEVTDMAGNPVAAGSLGTFTVALDSTPPTASLTAANVNAAGGTAYTFTVTYNDNTAIDVSSLGDDDVLVTGPSGFRQEATFVSVDTDSNGTPRTATYEITPPGGEWDVADNGTYTVSVQADEVTDSSGNPATAGSLGTFMVALDSTPPTASLNAANVSAAGGAVYTFTVTYTDNTAIDVSTLGNGDVLVTGPNSFSQAATFVSVDTDSDGTPRTATYRITPPGESWDSKDNGTYTVAVQAGQVTDTAGNAVATGSLGTFTVKAAADKTAPTAQLAAANVTSAGETVYSFTVTYADNVAVDVATLDNADILVTGPNGFKQAATFVSVTPAGHGTPRTATYNITPSGGAWSAANNGVYTVSMQSNQVKDTGGKPVKSGKLGTFTVDTETPAAALKASNVTKAGGKSYTFTVTYADNLAVDVSTLDNLDLLVTGPDGFSQAATLGKVNSKKDGTPRTATYKITPSGGAFSAANNGVYTVALQAGEATDTVGHAVASGVLGTFTVDTAAPTATLTAPNVATTGETAYTFTVTYTDNLGIRVATLDNLDVKVTGKGYSQLATLVSVDVDEDGTPRAATYRITPKGGAFSATNNGVYTVSMQSKQVTDLGGNPVKSGKLGTFTVDTAAPTASLKASNVTKAGAATYTFTVTYSDNIAVSVATLDNTDLLVTGPNGLSQLATLVSKPSKDGTKCKATYRITAPGGAWDAVDNGTYTVSVQSDQVADGVGNALAAGELGTFTVNVPAAKAKTPAAASTETMPFPTLGQRKGPERRAVFATVADWL